MSSQPHTPSAFRKAWYKWKALHLPWRKRFLIGLDLQGNTFWEFRDTLSSHKHRMRRIVHSPPSIQYSDLRISPSWHQWLRHTRTDAPSLSEQARDLVRQENLKVLVARADARWAAKASFLDAPGTRSAVLAGEVEDPSANGRGGREGGRGATGGGLEDGGQEMDAAAGEAVEGARGEGGKMQVPDGIRHQFAEGAKEEERKDDPWKKVRGGPSEEWQPKTWSGNAATKR